MDRKIFAGEALGYSRMHAAQKEDVIQYLAAAANPAPMRRRWYREWCKATFTKLRPEDLSRVAPGKPKEQQLGLLDESSGRGEAQSELAELPPAALKQPKARVTPLAAKTAGAAGASRTASTSGE